MVYLLLLAGADINWTPPDEKNYPRAPRPGSGPRAAAVLEYLISCGADVNITNPELDQVWTPLPRGNGEAVPRRAPGCCSPMGANPVPAQASPAEPEGHPFGGADLEPPDGRARDEGAWRDRRDWRKARVLIEAGGSETVDVLPRSLFATFFSLTVSVCRSERQLRRSIGSFANLVLMRMTDLLGPSREREMTFSSDHLRR